MDAERDQEVNVFSIKIAKRICVCLPIIHIAEEMPSAIEKEGIPPSE